MGLDTSHDCWHGSYSGFNRWRDRLAAAAGIPLRLMDGFYEAPDPTSMAWAAPREGGPLCGSHHGPFLHAWVRKASEPLPIAWSSLRPDVLHELLNHSDCDGTIPTEVCAPLADRLAELVPLLPDDEFRHRDATQRFIDGLRLAAKAGESVEFH